VAGLSIEDVTRLAQDPSPAARVGTAAKLAQQFNTSSFTPAEMRLAEQIFMVMVRDAEVRVREALSANLKHNPLLPHDVAVALAKDVDSVALPVLSASDVLTSEDLVQIVKGQGTPARLDAIAGRKEIPASVSAAIVDAGSESVVAKLLANPGADFAEPTLHKVVDKFGDSEAVQGPLVHRSVLPVTVAERLVTHVAEHLRAHLLASHKISPDLALDLVLHSRERATVGLAMGVSEAGLAALAAQLKDNNRLTASLVLRAICMGNLRFFEHAVAALAGVPIGNTRVLIHDPGRRGLKTAWTKAGFPASFLPAIEAALDVVGHTELDDQNPERYARRIIERILTQYEKIGVEFNDDDLEYLLAKVNQLPAVSQQVH
jgi:uncharacterized protein (DUF2336 family)